VVTDKVFAEATSITAIVHEPVVVSEVVEEIPAAATVVHQINGQPANQYPQLNPIQVRIAGMTTREMKEYLKSVGCKTTGNKAQLQDRVMSTI
jgi:hypothetical protein